MQYIIFRLPKFPKGSIMSRS